MFKRNKAGGSKSTPNRILKRGDIPLYLMALPTVLTLILFNYLPMSGLVLAFKKYNVRDGIFGSEWNGFKNFEFLFSSTDTLIILRNTVLYNIVIIALSIIAPLILALILNELYSKKLSKAYQTVYIIPHFLSWAVIAVFVELFLAKNSGIVNNLLEAIGKVSDTNWYATPKIWPPLLVGVSLWQSLGYNTILYVAAIAGVPPELYEAAVLDGASRFKQAIHVTIPHLRLVIAITLITSMGNIIRGDFGLFYTVTRNSGALYSVTNVLDVYIYNGLQQQANLGMTTAAGLFQSVVGFFMVLLSNKVVAKIDPDSSMF